MMKLHGIRLWMVLIGMALTGAVAQGLPATWYVAPTGNDGNAGTGWDVPLATISAGVTKSSNGDTILVSNGTYVVTAQIQVTKSITIQGLTGQRDSIVDGNYPTTTNRCFYLNNAGALVAGLTIRNGSYSGAGGGVFIEGYTGGSISNCTITANHALGTGWGAGAQGGGVFVHRENSAKLVGCTISSNTAVEGGGIFCNIGGLVVRDCIIMRNTADYVGGGFRLDYSGLITNCIVTENQATAYHGGGGVTANENSLYGDPPAIVGCTISMNTATGTIGTASGGGVELQSGRLVDCLVSNNAAAYFGGGVDSSGGTTFVPIDNCTITCNRAGDLPGVESGCGGGVYLSGDSGKRRIRNCLISGNYATQLGGGVAGGLGTIENCTIVRNDGKIGGGIIGEQNVISVSNSVCYYNHASSGNQDFYDYGIGRVVFSHCLVSGSPSGSDNITNLPPLFVADGSGYGTNAVAGDYHLKWIRVPRQISPCIDAGTNLDWMASATDLDGKARRYNSGIVDIGAYELTPPRPKGTVVLIQ